MRVTTLGYAILGLLTHNDRSGYAIRKVFEETALGSYSSTPGSIYPALKKLEKLGLITQVQNHESKSDKKKLFTLTSAGTEAFEEWLNYPQLNIADMPKELPAIMLRFSMMEPFREDIFIADFLTSLIKDLEEFLKELKAGEELLADTLTFTGAHALKSGVMSAEIDLKWAIETHQALQQKMKG